MPDRQEADPVSETNQTVPNEQTQSVDEADAQTTASAGSMPTPEEERLAEEGAAAAPDVSDDYQEALERGANVRGEGSIES